MSKRLKGKVAVVTGAGRGIGKAIALLMAEEGARVVVNDLGTDIHGSGQLRGPADEVVAEIAESGGTAVANYDSVAVMEGGEQIIKTAVDNFGRLDILVNNAGILRDRMIFNMTEEEWDTVISIHLKGHFNCTKYACMLMREQGGGRIINFSSEAGLGNAGQANYSAAKEGIIGFTRTVARDMGKYGVTCNAIRPRAATRMINTMRMVRDANITSALPPVSTFAQSQPEDIAPFVVYLASDEASLINGCDFIVGGGTISIMSQPRPIETIYKEGRWTLDELSSIVPQTLAANLINPASAQR